MVMIMLELLVIQESERSLSSASSKIWPIFSQKVVYIAEHYLDRIR